MIRKMLHYRFSDIVLSIILSCYWFIGHIIKVSIFAMSACTGLFQPMLFPVILQIIAPLQIVSANHLNNISRAELFSFITAASVFLHSPLRRIEYIHSITC